LLSFFVLLVAGPLRAANATLLDDTWVGSGAPDTPHHTGEVLQAQNVTGDIKQIYLRFNVTAAQVGTAAPKAAILTLVQSTGPAAHITVYAADNGWSGGIDWGEKPDFVPSKVLAGADVTGINGSPVDFDVKEYISGPGEYTFCIRSDATSKVQFYSSDNSSGQPPPVLSITKATSQADLTRKPPEIVLRSQDYLDRYYALAVGGAYDVDKIGYFNVKKAPYHAKGDGSTDDTLAIQRAVNEARDSRVAVFFPAGTYLVSDTIECVQGVVDPESTGPFACTYNERWNQREFANILIGPGAGNRATIKLVSGAEGFQTNDNPKPVLHVWSRGNAKPYSPPADKNQLDININQSVSNIDLDLTGSSNPKAIGIDMAGAQGTSMSRMTIKAQGAYAGIKGLPGPGGSTADVTINGGKYGIYAYLSGAGDGNDLQGLSPLLHHCTINNSVLESIRWNGSGTMVLVGCKILGRGLFIAGSGSAGAVTPHRGNLNIVDSVIDLASAGPAVTGSRSVYMRNVYCRNVNSPASISTAGIEPGGGDSTPPSKSIPSSGWSLISEYYDGAKLDQFAGDAQNAEFTPSYLNSAAPALDLTLVTPAAIPAGFLDRHRWTTTQPLPQWALDPTSPSVDSLPVLNVKKPPYFAKGNGINDDTSWIQKAIDDADVTPGGAAVFIPAGEYVISSTLQLRESTVLFGLNKNICRLKANEPAGTKDFQSALAPLVRSKLGTSAANDTTTLAELTLFQRMTTTNCYLLRWEAGADSSVQNVNFDRHFVSGNSGAADMTVPLVKVNETGGGKWYNFWVDGSNAQGPGYRHFQLTRTTAGAANEALTFYMFNPETDLPNIYCAEFIRSWNIDVFQSKFEGKSSPSVNLDSCRQFRWFGFAGNAYVPSGSQSIRLLNCLNFLLAGQSYQYNSNGPSPISFSRVKDTYGTGPTTVTTPGEKTFVVYRRGSPLD